MNKLYNKYHFCKSDEMPNKISLASNIQPCTRSGLRIRTKYLRIDFLTNLYRMNLQNTVMLTRFWPTYKNVYYFFEYVFIHMQNQVAYLQKKFTKKCWLIKKSLVSKLIVSEDVIVKSTNMLPKISLTKTKGSIFRMPFMHLTAFSE